MTARLTRAAPLVSVAAAARPRGLAAAGGVPPGDVGWSQVCGQHVSFSLRKSGLFDATFRFKGLLINAVILLYTSRGFRNYVGLA